jgi:hypothetical protein
MADALVARIRKKNECRIFVENPFGKLPSETKKVITF